MKQQLTVRVGRGTLSFAQMSDDGQNIVFEPYVVKSGVSMAANLREAFKTCDVLMDTPPKVRVLIDGDVLMVPIEVFSEGDLEELYSHAYPREEHSMVAYNVLPDLNVVAAFAVNRDLKLVFDDHFQNTSLISAMTPVWRHMHQRSFTGARAKLYAYFHERRLELFSFRQNRFRFCNSFEASRPHDQLFFICYVWKQLQMDQEYDELHLMGSTGQQEWLVQQLHRYMKKVYVLNPSAIFQQAAVTEIKTMPFDLMTLFVKGR